MAWVRPPHCIVFVCECVQSGNTHTSSPIATPLGALTIFSRVNVYALGPSAITYLVLANPQASTWPKVCCRPLCTLISHFMFFWFVLSLVADKNADLNVSLNYISSWSLGANTFFKNELGDAVNESRAAIKKLVKKFYIRLICRNVQKVFFKNIL